MNTIMLRTRDSVRERLKKWVRALRSGEYTQVREKLHTNEGFCCLGVACDLYMDSFGGRWMPQRDEHGHFVAMNRNTPYTFMGDTDVMPDDVASYFGISERDQITLSRMNDNGSPFSEIADYIENNIIGNTRETITNIK